MSVTNLWAGGTTSSSFRVVGKVDGESVRLLVSTEENLSGAVAFGPETPDAQDIVQLEATGLDPSTLYHYALEVDSTPDTSMQGRIRTFPVEGEPAVFSFAAWSCAGNPGAAHHWPESSGDTDVSNSPAFSDVRAHDPLFVVHMGDLHYRDIDTDSPSLFREAYDDVLSAPHQRDLYLSTTLAYVWDDHDYGSNNSHSGSPAKDAAAQVYRERVPHYPLPATNGSIFQSFVVGRVRVALLDIRFNRDDHGDLANDHPDKTHLGDEQKAWLFDLLETADEEFLVLFVIVPWISSPSSPDGISDAWGNYIVERDEIVQEIVAHGWSARTVVVAGDMHALALDDGENNQWGGFPVCQFAALDASGSAKGGPYQMGPSQGLDRYGVVEVDDRGDRIRVTATGYIGSTAWNALAWRIPEPRPLETPTTWQGEDVVQATIRRGSTWSPATTRVAR